MSRKRSLSPRAPGGELAADVELAVLDGGAAIPDHAHAHRFGAPRGVGIAEPQLEPHRAHAARERIVHDIVKELPATKDVDEIDLFGCGDVHEPVVRGLALDERPAELRIDRDDPVPMAAEVRGYRIARTVGLGGVADDGDDPGRPEERAREVGLIHFRTSGASRTVLSTARGAG